MQQQRRASADQSAPFVDHKRRNVASEGHSSFLTQVKMRLKKEKANNGKENNHDRRASSSALVHFQRPYSCDVETLAASRRGVNLFHAYFYDHQVLDASKHSRNTLAHTKKRMNSSIQKLSSVADEEENEHENHHSIIHFKSPEPPMAAEEDFALESSMSSPDEIKLTSRNDSTITNIPKQEKIVDRLFQSSNRHLLDSRYSASSERTSAHDPVVNYSNTGNTYAVQICHEERASLDYGNGSTQLGNRRKEANDYEQSPIQHGASSTIDRQQFPNDISVHQRTLVSHQQPCKANSSFHESKLESGLVRRAQCQNLVVSVTSFDETLLPVTPLSYSTSHYPYQRSASSKSSETVQQLDRSSRGSLRRAKAVDFPVCDNQQQNTAPSSINNSPVKENQKSSNQGTVPRTKRNSIFRRLIGGGSGSRNGSTEETESPPFSSVLPTVSLMASALPCPTAGGRAFSSAGLTVISTGTEPSSSVRSDFSSDSSDFKYEERVRKRIFAHYDCVSICADVRPLLNGTSRLKDANLSGPTGASQASKPFLITASTAGKSFSSASNAESTLMSPDDMGFVATSDQQINLGKSNDILLSCPYFINEIGGEPIRQVSLGRNTYTVQPPPKRFSTVSCACPNCLYPYDPDDPQSGACLGGGYQSQPVDEFSETWHRSATAAEASVLENLSNVYLGGRLCAKRQPQLVIEHVDQGAFYYRHCFSGRAHQNYFGIDESLGPIAISAIRDKVEGYDTRRFGLISPYVYRLIIRLSDLTTFRGAILEESLPSYLSAKESREQQIIAGQTLQQSGQMTPGTGPASIIGMSTGIAAGGVGGGGSTRGKIPMKELLELVVPELQPSCLRLAVPLPRTEELLLKLDEQAVYTRYKVGILYCRAEQSSEEQMYNNEVAGPAFDEFLDMLGQRVRLKGFDKYKGGLDCKGDTTGSYSLYTSYQQYEIMFHVSTMLPFTPQNRQQLARKRHIGNDIVTVVFQEPGALPFSPQTVRSHFQHVFIVIRAHKPNTDNVRYSIAVSRYKDVPRFGPPIPPGAIFPKSKDFRDFLLTKIINAENAVHKSDKFATMAARTRKEFIRDLAEHHTTSHTLDGGASGKIASILLGGSAKRKDRPKPKLHLEEFVRGAIVWEVQVLTQVEDFSLCRPIECYLGISADNLVLIEQSAQETLFCTPTHSIIGWTSHGNSLKLYYDHADVIILRTLDDEDSCEMQEIVKRLHVVSKGCETIEMILRRSPTGQLGFHIQHEGIVSDVEMYGYAWQAGLRQGSRIVEICKVSVATLIYERILELLRTSVNLRVLAVPPLTDGSPRRGCEDPYCSAVLGDEWPFVQSGASSSSRSVVDNQLPTEAAFSRPNHNLNQDIKDRTSMGMDSRVSEMQTGYELVSRRAVANSVGCKNQVISGIKAGQEYQQSPDFHAADSSDYGYESGPTSAANYFASKSLDDIQHRRDRRHSDGIRCTSADPGPFHTGHAHRYRPNTNKNTTVMLNEHWYANDDGDHTSTGTVSGTGPRTNTFGSDGSTASSEMSTDVTINRMMRKPSRPSDLKRKVDRANSDMLQRINAIVAATERPNTNKSPDTGNPPHAPHLQPRNYMNIKSGPSKISSTTDGPVPRSLDSSHLHVPGMRQRSSSSSSSVQENLIRLINDLESSGDIEEALVISTALKRLSDDEVGYSANVTATKYGRGNSRLAISHCQRSPEKERGAEWSSLVDAAARAIEGLSYRSASASGHCSPELSGYRLRLQAASQRVKLLEEKVDRVQAELEAERESKRGLEIEVLRLRDVNKRLEEECTHAKMELKKFTEWFFAAVENSSTGNEANESNLSSRLACTIPFVDDVERKSS